MIKFKGIMGRVSKGFQTFVGKTFSTQHLFTAQNSPNLINAVMQDLKRTDAGLILVSLQKLEKAIYHLAARHKEVLEKQDVLEQQIVSMHSTLEEMLHGMEGVEEEEALGWENKKGASSLN